MKKLVGQVTVEEKTTIQNSKDIVVDGLTVDVLAVENDFFGHTVTCTGLLTGKDMLAALQKYLSENKADEVLLAGNTMKEFEDVFLCGMTLTQLETALAPYGVKVRVNRDGGEGLVKILRSEKAEK